MLTDTLSGFLGRQRAFGLHDRLLLVCPLRLDRVPPRRLDRQIAHPDLAAAPTLDRAVVRPDPASHPLADVPGGVVPDQHEHLLPLGREPRTQPAQKVLGHLADGPALDEPQQHRPGIRTQQAKASLPPPRSLGNSRRGSSPAQANRLGWARRVHQVSSWKPSTQSGRAAARAISSSRAFFHAYSGSGLTNQCLARFQPTPRRLSTRRILSPLSRRVVHPFSKQTWAASGSVHRLVGLPKVRGD